MKEAVLLSQLLILPARALEDDLFWRPDPLAPTVRNFVWQGKIHQSVRIQHYDGTNVTLATTEGTIIVPLSRLPPFGAAQSYGGPGPALHPVPPPPKAFQSAGAGRRTGRKSGPGPSLSRNTPPWRNGGPPGWRRWPGWRDNGRRTTGCRCGVIESEMSAWEQLYPPPPVPKAVEEREAANAIFEKYPASEEPFRTRSVELPPDPFAPAPEDLAAYNKRRTAVRIKVVEAAREVARAAWPNIDNAPERAVREKKLMTL